MESVGAARQADDRSPGAQMGAEQHDVLAAMLHHRRVVNGLDRVGDVGFGEDGIVRVSSDDVGFMIASRFQFENRLVDPFVGLAPSFRWRKAARLVGGRRLRSISPSRSRARTASSTLLTRKPVRPSSITSRQEPRSMAITGTPAALASARTSPNRSGMVFRCSSARACANNSFLPGTSTGPM